MNGLRTQRNELRKIPQSKLFKWGVVIERCVEVLAHSDDLLICPVVAHIRDGKLVMKRGELRGQVRDDVEEVLAGAGVKSGFIALSAAGKVHFSPSIPTSLHQRLRIVLLN